MTQIGGLLLLLNMSESPGGEKKGKAEVSYRRHSKAQYLTDAAMLASKNALSEMDRNNQITPDLSKEGVELARKTAEEYFVGLDPKEDKIFLVSSNLARALETAKIYADIAREKGFQIIRPENVRGKQAEEIAGGDVRVISRLAIPRSERPLAGEVFNTDSALGKIDWSNVDPGFRAKWEEAHAIIMANDQGSWGRNFDMFSDKIIPLFPEFKVGSKTDAYLHQFQPLVRLAEWGIKKARERDPEASIKIMAFGHENYLGVALDKYFKDHAIANCEAITFALPEDGTMTMTRMRDNQTTTLEEETRRKLSEGALGTSMSAEERAARRQQE